VRRSKTITTTIHTSGECAGTIAQRLAGLAEVEMITAARGFGCGALRRGVIAAKDFEVCDAVRAPMMAVEIHNKEIAAS
jgi:hypothetical protein